MKSIEETMQLFGVGGEAYQKVVAEKLKKTINNDENILFMQKTICFVSTFDKNESKWIDATKTDPGIITITEKRIVFTSQNDFYNLLVDDIIESSLKEGNTDSFTWIKIMASDLILSRQYLKKDNDEIMDLLKKIKEIDLLIQEGSIEYEIKKSGGNYFQHQSAINSAKADLLKNEKIIFATNGVIWAENSELGINGIIVITDKKIILSNWRTYTISFSDLSKIMLKHLDVGIIWFYGTYNDKYGFIADKITNSKLISIIQMQNKEARSANESDWSIKVEIEGAVKLTDIATDNSLLKAAPIPEEDKKYIVFLNQCQIDIKEATLADAVSEIKRIVESIYDNMELFPDNKKSVSKLNSYYLPTLKKILETYLAIQDKNIENNNTILLKQEVIKGVNAIKAAFYNLYENMFIPTVIDTQAEIMALNSIIAMDGLISFDEESNSI